MDSFGNDLFLTSLDKIPADHMQERLVFHSVVSVLRPWGFSPEKVEGQDGMWDDVPESFAPAVKRVIAFSKATVCLLDAQPLFLGASAKDIFPLARYTGKQELESCLRDNIKNTFFQDRYQAEQKAAAASKVFAVKLTEEIDRACDLKARMLKRKDKDNDKNQGEEEGLDVCHVASTCCEILKARAEMVNQLRPDACQRLDHELSELVAHVAGLIVELGDDIDLASVGATVEEFYASSQQFVSRPAVAEALAALLGWKKSHQKGLDRNALEQMIKNGHKHLPKDFDVHECQRLVEISGEISEQQYMSLAFLLLGKLQHQAVHASKVLSSKTQRPYTPSV